MIFIITNVILAAIPVAVILYFFLRRDSRRKETRYYIWRAFVLGFVALFPAAIVEAAIAALRLQISPIATHAFRAYIVSGFVEETTKLLVVLAFIYRKPYFERATDGIIYTVTTSLGLAFFENILYSFGSVSTLILRGLTAVPLHASTAGIMGYFVGQSRFADRTQFIPGLAAAVALHGTYNFLLFNGGWQSWASLPLLLAAVVVARRLYLRTQQDDIDAERR